MQPPRSFIPHSLIPTLLALVSLLLPLRAVATVSVTTLFGDHMVLQRDRPLLFWGLADAGEMVTVSMAGNTVQVAADSEGQWKAQLPALPAGGPHTLSIKGDNELVFQDVLVGEVWIASGQSNMGMTVGGALNADLARITARRNPEIRMLRVRNLGSQEPQSEIKGQWTIASAGTVDKFSAVGYAFAETLHAALGIPVGVIENAWGGSNAETWVDRSVIAADPELKSIHEEWLGIEATYDFDALMAAYPGQIAEWEAAVAEAKSAGLKPPQKPRQPLNRMVGQHRPGNLWNARVLPIAPVVMRGVIWYQGEGNAHSVERAHQYQHLFTTLIDQWRGLWGKEFPFYWVQLADFNKEAVFGETETWPVVRESQTNTLHSRPHTGQAVIIDLGEGKDIHPRHKEEVGRRLARWALNRDYGYSDLVCRSPEFDFFQQEGSKLVVGFNYTGGGLRAFDTNVVHGFVVKSEDGTWHEVKGLITADDTVELALPDESLVVALRYA
ncbi:MAG TPA: sialate O-acetylesterase, partial [Oceanipulchritudo sp.]|nr:sialate O-acetylesterase [Oceanipulchritudo sp.]